MHSLAAFAPEGRAVMGATGNKAREFDVVTGDALGPVFDTPNPYIPATITPTAATFSRWGLAAASALGLEPAENSSANYLQVRKITNIYFSSNGEYCDMVQNG